MRARGRHPEDREFGDHAPDGSFDPRLEVLLGYLRVVRDQSGQVHRVSSTALVVPPSVPRCSLWCHPICVNLYQSVLLKAHPSWILDPTASAKSREETRGFRRW